MRARVGLIVGLALVALTGCGGSTRAEPSTEIVRWSPFDVAGGIKKTLEVREIQALGSCGELGPGSEAVGDVGYRCDYGNFILDPCWRDGPGRTQFIVCAGNPWTTSVERLRVPRLMLRVGVTFGRPLDRPWGLELTNGDHCTAAQGAHDRVTGRGGGLVVDYYCTSGIVLLRNLRRGRLWRIGSARANPKRFDYKLLGEVTVRKAFFGDLPAAMQRENELARQAADVATAVVRSRNAKRRRSTRFGVYTLRVRLVLPSADWANAEGFAGAGSSFGDWRVVFHRVDGRWVEALEDRPYCVRLPRPARRQLLAPSDCKGVS